MARPLPPLAPALRAVSFEADQVALVLTDPDVVVVPIMAVHGAQVPWGKVVTSGVPVVAAGRLPGIRPTHLFGAAQPLQGQEPVGDRHQAHAS